MTSLSQRRRHILKIRAVNRRMAEQLFGQSEADLRHATKICDRVATLRATIGSERGIRPGSELRAESEMIVRLDGALTNITSSMLSLTQQRDRQRKIFLSARQNEIAAEKLVEAGVKAEHERHERRQDKARIFRRTADLPEFGG